MTRENAVCGVSLDMAAAGSAIFQVSKLHPPLLGHFFKKVSIYKLFSNQIIITSISMYISITHFIHHHHMPLPYNVSAQQTSSTQYDIYTVYTIKVSITISHKKSQEVIIIPPPFWKKINQIIYKFLRQSAGCGFSGTQLHLFTQKTCALDNFKIILG